MPALFRQADRARINNQSGFMMTIHNIDKKCKGAWTMEKQQPNDEAPHILIIDDDDRIRGLLQQFLSDHGLRVTTAENTKIARNFLQSLAFDLLIVDIMMPGEDGISFTKSFRKTSSIPVLMLTAKSDINDRIVGLETGADDYLSKPFEPRELLLRTNNILRRLGPPADATIELISFGPFSFNLERGELKRGEEIVRLTDREKEMMRIFCQAAGDCVPRHTLLADPESAGERTVDVQINRLRRKLEADITNPVYLHTVRGVGYRLLIEQ